MEASPFDQAPSRSDAGPEAVGHQPSVTGVRAADLGGRRLIDLKTDDWLRFVTDRPAIHCVERLEGSLQWVGRETDVLLRVADPEAGEFLVIIELQLRPDPRMAIRVEAYSALAEEKFGLPVYAVVVIILPGTQGASDHYQSSVLGLSARRDFRVIRLWEQDARAVAEVGAAGLLPLVPVMKGGSDLGLLAFALDRLRSMPDLAGMERLLAHFAGLVLDRASMLELMRWHMESAVGLTFYQEVLNEGLEQGRHEAALRSLLRVLVHRFGPDAEDLRADLAALEDATLERLLEAAVDAASLEAFRAALRN